MTVDTLAYDYGYHGSGMMNNLENNTIIEHQEYYCTYQYECGKSFLEICRDLGLDKNNTVNISFL